MSLDSLQQRLSENTPGVLDNTGQPLSITQIRRLACDCHVLPMVLGSDSQPLDVGREERTAPPHIRAALLVRDGHCAFPECDQPPGTPEAHHIVSWLDGGDTALANMTMICAAHHRIVHNKGWVIKMIDGRPTFLPPSTVDPWRRPRPGNRPRGQPDLETLAAGRAS
jgi:hypothetical protein